MYDGHVPGVDGQSPARMPRTPRSLRAQLVTIPTIILLAGLAATVGTVLLDAQARIAAEIRSAMELGGELVRTSLQNVSDASSPALAFEQLAEELPRVRHVQFELVPTDDALFAGSNLGTSTSLSRSRPWLARLFAPAPREEVFPVTVRGEVIGEIRLRSNSADEIAEIVGEVKLFSGTLVALCLLIVASLLWTVRRSLRPLQVLVEGFDRLERGDYQSIVPIPIAEFRRIGQQFNCLARSLRRVTDDNHRLVDKLLSVQEEERKQLAAELHDEFGPALFGIRAETACILKSLPDDERQRTPIRTHAHAIAQLTDGIQKLNYRMLDRLRPLVLEQMGLSDALRQLLASWQVRYPDMSWSLVIPRGFHEPAEAVSLTLYRIVQEAVTNTIRHAEASAVEIHLWCDALAGGTEPRSTKVLSTVALSVTDDGTGLPENFHYGFGLLGMSERVRQLGGTLRIANGDPKGVIVQALIPEQEAVSIEVSVHADSVD
jgi:two-component system, NarL family, sensor histidine kinase UhpB